MLLLRLRLEEVAQRAQVMEVLVPRLRSLALLAKSAKMGLNIDAEEADRLSLSLDVIETVLSEPALAGWDVAMLRALREVETGLASYEAEMRRNRDLAEAQSQAQDYARRTAARVRYGDAAGLLQVDAERTLATARLARVQSDMALAQAEVTLFRALGGGWRGGAQAR